MKARGKVILALEKPSVLTVVVGYKGNAAESRESLGNGGIGQSKDAHDEIGTSLFVDEANRFGLLRIDDEQPDLAAGFATCDGRHAPDGVLGARDRLNPRSRPQKCNERENPGKVIVLHASLQTQQVPSSLRNGV